MKNKLRDNKKNIFAGILSLFVLVVILTGLSKITNIIAGRPTVDIVEDQHQGPIAPIDDDHNADYEPRDPGGQDKASIPNEKIRGKFVYEEVPPFEDEPYYVLNNNVPYFLDEDEEILPNSYERYSEFDSLGRVGVADSIIGIDLMPTEERGRIGMVKPSGWNQERYDDLIKDKYLYNRCHLIGFQLAGENANEKNLMTGTRYFNVTGMLPFENMVADYVRYMEGHVRYRITPVFIDNELVARGIIMEGYSIEDEGEEVMFNVFVYNSQPGIEIDYLDGSSERK